MSQDGPLARAFDAYGRGIVRHRLWAALAVLLITGLAIGGAAHRVATDGAPVDFTPQALFMDEGGELARLHEIEDRFGAEDNVLTFLLVGREALATPAGIAAIATIHRNLAEHQDVLQVDSIAQAPLLEAGGDGLLRVVDPVSELSPAEAMARVAADPLLQDLFVSRDGEVASVRVRIRPEAEKWADLAPIVLELKARAESVARPPGLDLHITGVPWVRTEVIQLMLDDEVRFFPLTAVLFGLTIWAFYRRFWLGTAPLFSVLFAVVWAIGALFASGAEFNLLSTMAPMLVLIIGAADGIHLTSRYREEMAALPPGTAQPREIAMGRTVVAMATACFLTTFTTSAGFFSLCIADTKVIRDFGWQSGCAVMVAFFAVMLVLPTWLAFIPAHRVPPRKLQVDGAIHRVLHATDGLVRRRPRRVLIACLAACGLAGIIGSQVDANSHLLELYHDGMATHQSLQVAEASIGGIVPIMAHLSGEPGSMIEPEILDRMAQVQAEFSRQEMTGWTGSLAEVVGHVHSLLSGEAGLPTTREAVAQELLLAEMSGDLGLSAYVTDDHSEARVLVLAKDAGGNTYNATRAHMQTYVDGLFAGTGVTAFITGDGFIASTGADHLIDDLLASLALIFAVILATMFLLLRDLRLALIGALPNLAPLIFTLAALGVMGADLQVSNIVSFTVAIGMAVDDTIHFVVRYGEERARGRTLPEAISATYHGAGRAIVITSMLLIIGFGVLGFSEITSTRHFGVLTAITMGAAMLGDLLLLPALLHLAGRGQSKGA